jgi:hypothetical protein
MTTSHDHAATPPVVRAALAGLAAGLGASALGALGCGADVKQEGAASAAPAAAPASAATVAQAHEKKANCCVGKNECKGKGGCRTDANECAGKNECKGKGGCSMRDCPK